MAINHANCDHPRTPKGRAACRSGRVTSTPAVPVLFDPVATPMVSIPFTTNDPKPGRMMAKAAAHHADCDHADTARARGACDQRAILRMMELGPDDVKAGSVVRVNIPVMDAEDGEMEEVDITVLKVTERDGVTIWVFKDRYPDHRFAYPTQLVNIISI